MDFACFAIFLSCPFAFSFLLLLLLLLLVVARVVFLPLLPSSSSASRSSKWCYPAAASLRPRCISPSINWFYCVVECTKMKQNMSIVYNPVDGSISR